MKGDSFSLNVADPFWVVTDRSPVSELGDICFRTTIARLRLQVLGGLELEERHATVYFLEADARKDAEARLAARRAYDAALGEVRP